MTPGASPAGVVRTPAALSSSSSYPIAIAGTRSMPYCLALSGSRTRFTSSTLIFADSRGSSSRICRVCRHVPQPSVWVKNSSRTFLAIAAKAARDVPDWRVRSGPRLSYLNRSSNACRALVGPGVPVCRSTVVRGANSAHSFRLSFGETRPEDRAGCIRSGRSCRTTRTGCSCGDRRRIASSGWRPRPGRRAGCRIERSGIPRGRPSGWASADRTHPAVAGPARAAPSSPAAVTLGPALTGLILIPALPVFSVAHSQGCRACHGWTALLPFLGRSSAIPAYRPQQGSPMKARRAWTGVAGIAGIVVALTVTVALPSAQRREPMTLVDVAELPRIIDPQLSPDGRYVIYMLSQADWRADRPVWHLWKQDTQGGSPSQLTSGTNGDVPGTARWSPDGASILFVRDGQIALVPAGGGEPRQLTRHATGVSAPTWSPDGTSIYFLAFDPGTAEERDRDRLRDDVYAVDENYKERQLWNFAVASGTEKKLTAGDSTVVSYRLSRNGTRIALQRAPTPLVDDAHKGEVWVMDANGENARAITRNDVEEGQPELSPDNSQVLFLAETNDKFEPYYNSNLFVVPAGGGRPTLLMPDFPYAIDQASWSPDGRSIFAVVNMGVHSEIFQIDLRVGEGDPAH